MATDGVFAPSILGNPPTAGQTTAVLMATGAPAANTATISMPGYNNTMMVTNGSSLVAFVAVVSNLSYTITAADTPVLANNRVIVACPDGPATLLVGAKPAATLGAGASVYFTPGIGGGSQT